MEGGRTDTDKEHQREEEVESDEDRGQVLSFTSGLQLNANDQN